MASYGESSQKRLWTLTRKDLQERRERLIHIDSQDHNTRTINAWEEPARICLFELTNELGFRLQARQRVIATAHTYQMRLLTKVTLHEMNAYLIVATSLYVAAKVEEQPQHVRTVCNEARGLWPDRMPYEPTQIAECEFYLIDELSSCLIIYHPYFALDPIRRAMSQYIALSAEEVQGTWEVLNDSYACDVMLLYRPSVIVLAAIYFTLLLRPHLCTTSTDPQKRKKRVESLAQFLGQCDCNLDELANCVQEILSLYARWEKHNQKRALNELNKALV